MVDFWQPILLSEDQTFQSISQFLSCLDLSLDLLHESCKFLESHYDFDFYCSYGYISGHGFWTSTSNGPYCVVPEVHWKISTQLQYMRLLSDSKGCMNYADGSTARVLDPTLGISSFFDSLNPIYYITAISERPPLWQISQWQISKK